MDEPRRRRVPTVDSVSIAYSEFGSSSGPAVVLCHGICAASRQFDAEGPYFAAAGYRVLVPDLRAHGDSGVPQGSDADFSIARMAGDMQAMLDDAGADRVHWVGNSLGGIVGLAMLADRPERFASFATFGTAYRLALPAVAPSALPLLYKIGADRLGRITAAMTTTNPRGRAAIAEMIAAFDPDAGLRIAQHLRAYDLRAPAQRYAGPILLMRCGFDRAVNLALPDTFAAMAGHPNFQRIDLPRAGHCANYDMPSEWRAALETFWRRAEAGPSAVSLSSDA